MATTAYLPAGYSDDDSENDFDDFDGYDHPNVDVDVPESQSNVETNAEGWTHPRCLSPIAGQDYVSASKDAFTFLKTIQSNDVFGVSECLKVGGSLVDQNFGSSFLSAGGGARPIFVACVQALPEMLSLLIQFGADLGPDSYDQLTPLMSLCSSSASHDSDESEFETRLVRCAEILVETGKVDVNARQSQKMTALMFAAKQGHDSLVKFLIENGAQLDAVESQNWTALAFAVDAEKGNVARRLLEAGANPDIATLDGPLPIDMANGRNNCKLAAVIKSFAHRAQLTRVDPGLSEVTKFSELDNILLGLDAAQYIPLFNQHGLNLETFLELNEQDLEKIGVDKIGIRKKISQAIIDIHKKEWEKSSLSKIMPKDKQSGIYLTCPDAVLLLANMSQHFKFLSANLQFLKRHLREKPEMLLIGKDVADASHLANRILESRQNLSSTSKQLKEVEAALAAACKKLGVEVGPSDHLSTTRQSKRRIFAFLSTSAVILSSVGVVYVVSKMFTKN